MANYVFLNAPAWGHVNPTLAVVQELVKRGHHVSYYITEEFRATVEATGATFQPYKSKLQDMTNGVDETGKPASTSGPGLGPRIFMIEDGKYVPPQVIDRIRAEQPDAIIYDFMCGWAKVVIDELHVPAIAMRATYAANEHFDIFKRMGENMKNMPEFAERMKALMSMQAGSSPNPMESLLKEFSQVEQLNIIFMPKAFQPMAETFDERYVFVGPSILPRHQQTAFPFERLNNEQPLLYISLGSVFNNQPEFYKTCFEAFAQSEWQVVLSVGKKIDLAQLGPIPANFLLSPYVPQLDILPRTAVYVTHAGTNSLMESLYYGVPMVLIPQQPEQQMHAQRAAEMDLGTLLNKGDVTPTSLREAVQHVAQDAKYRENAQKMRHALQREGGYQQAADAIIQFTQGKVRV